MRVLVGMPSKDSLGGPIFCEPPFVKALRAAGVEVDEVVYVYGDGLAPVTPIQRIVRVLFAALALRQRARNGTYDVVHLNTSFDEKSTLRDLATLIFLRSCKVPVFLKMHGSMATFLKTKSKFWRLLQRQIFSLADGIGVLSMEEWRNFVESGCPSEKLFDVTNVFESDRFHHDSTFHERHDVAEELPILLFSSRFLRSKGLMDVIAACRVLKNEGREFVLFCLGDGPTRAEAEKLVVDLELDKHIRFTGYIPEAEASDFHANSDIFVFPTYHDEGLPVVLLKSLAAGLPIITTHIRAAADYLTEPANCLWVEPQDPEGLAARIVRLLDDKELRQEMAENNRHLTQEFSAERVVQDYMKVYRALVNGSR